jgi:hypothetical protein
MKLEKCANCGTGVPEEIFVGGICGFCYVDGVDPTEGDVGELLSVIDMVPLLQRNEEYMPEGWED